MTAPTMNSKSAYSITRLRPNLSARIEERGEAMRANNDVEDVMIDLSNEVRFRSDKELPIDTRVADMTPVSSILGQQS